jgi:hypothetical protein
MNVTIETSRVEWSKGWFMTKWSLIVNGKEFLLGQDVKWVLRVVCMDLNEFFEMLGTDDRTPEGREKIGKWIVDYLELTPKIIKKLQPWSLAQ